MRKFLAYFIIFTALVQFLIDTFQDEGWKIKTSYTLLTNPKKYFSKDLLIITDKINLDYEGGFYIHEYRGYFKNHPKEKGRVTLPTETFHNVAKFIESEDKWSLKVWHNDFIRIQGAVYLNYSEDYPKLFSYNSRNILALLLSYILFIPSIFYIFIKRKHN